MRSYKEKIKSIDLKIDLSKKTYPYIISDIDKISNFVKSLYNENILSSDKLKICDIGFGLGLSLFDIKNQFDEIGITNNQYYGIENDNNLIEIFNNEFKDYWNNNIKVINSSANEANYSSYDLIYTYLIFKEREDILEFYNRVFDDMKIGSVFYEHRNWGLSDKKYLLRIERDDILKQPIYFGGHLNYIFIKK